MLCRLSAQNLHPVVAHVNIAVLRILGGSGDIDLDPEEPGRTLRLRGSSIHAGLDHTDDHDRILRWREAPTKRRKGSTAMQFFLEFCRVSSFFLFAFLAASSSLEQSVKPTKCRNGDDRLLDKGKDLSHGLEVHVWYVLCC